MAVEPSVTGVSVEARGRGLSTLKSGPPAILWVPAGVVALAMALPLVYLLVRSLGAEGEVWGLLFRARTLQILLRSVALVLAVSAACVATAVPLAWLTVRTDLPFRRVWSILTFLPLVIPSYVGAFLVVVALGPRGMLQGWLEPLGVQRLPDIYGFPGAALSLTLLSYPYVLLTVRAALGRLDPALAEAARGMGSSTWAIFRRVDLPLLRPSIAAGALLVALYTLSDFGAVSLLDYETFTWAIYLRYESFNRALAAILSLVLALVATGILLGEGASRGRARYYRIGGGSIRTMPPVRLGRWRWPALSFCALVVLLALVLPLSILFYWVVRGVAAGEPFRLVWGPAMNSVYVSGMAAVATVAAALPLAILAVRFPGRLTAALERLSYLGFALPGIVVALALVFFGLNLVSFLYQTLALLVFAYVLLFLPAALGALRSSLLQVSPRLEEAARSLGSGPRRVLAAITLPLVRPGILAGGALVFLVTMKELPATLILSPIGFKTLATSTWAAASEAFFAQAATAAILLVIASCVGLALFFVLPDRQRQ